MLSPPICTLPGRKSPNPGPTPDKAPEANGLACESGGVLAIAANGIMVAANPRFLEITGCPSFAIVGRHVRYLLDNNHWPGLYLSIRARLETCGSWEGQIENVKQPAHVGSCWLSVLAVTDGAGKVMHYIATLTDLSRRIALTQALRDSEEQLLLTMDAAQDAVIGMDREGHITAWNTEAVRMFGHTREAALGRPVADLIVPPALRTAHVQGIAHYLGTGTGGIIGRRVETVALRRDGSEFPVEIAIAAVRQGNDLFFNAFLRDITERKRVERELRVAATAFETQEGIMITDARSIILRVNRAFAKLTGYETAEVVGRTPAVLSSGKHDAAFYQQLWLTLARDRYWQGEIWNRRKSGEVFPEWLTITAVCAPDGEVTHYVAAFSDITERKRAEQQIRDMAYFDSLTHLPNRTMLLDRLQQSFSASARRGNYGALLFIDLDRFKELNDTRGHDYGDLLLIEVAKRLLACVRGEDTVARIGGDEFVVMLSRLADSSEEAVAQAGSVGEKILAATRLPCQLREYPHLISCSVGICLFRGHEQTAEDLLKHADVAMYQAKSAGRGAIRFFDPAMQAALDGRAAMEAELREVVARGQLEFHFQAQVDAARGVVGAEVLLRWHHPQRGWVAPTQFIPLAEESGLIAPIEQWCLDTACAQLKYWESQPQANHLQIALNISVRQFRQADFVPRLEAALAAYGANPARLTLELTESLTHEDVDDTIRKMHALKSIGVHIGLDNFGSGASSLDCIRRLPLDHLKIAPQFVRGLPGDANDIAIVKSIIGMANNLGLGVIAEGVELESQRALLAHLGCFAFQGYLFGRPAPVSEFEVLVANSNAGRIRLPRRAHNRRQARKDFEIAASVACKAATYEKEVIVKP